MKFQKWLLLAVALVALGGFTQRSYAQSSDLSYTEGPVVTVSYIRTEPGRFDDYMAYLAGNYKHLAGFDVETLNNRPPIVAV